MINGIILVSPPHHYDTVGMYMMAVASEDSGISVFTSSYDIEIRQMIESTFPFVCVLPGENLLQGVKSLTQGEGCDVCVKFTSGELNTSLDLVGTGGRFLQCAKPLEIIDMEKLQQNKTFKLIDVKKAFLSFLSKSDEEIQTLMFDMRDGTVGKLMEQGYPETKGLLYSLDEQSHFLNPLPISKILNILEEPGVNLTDSFKSMMESDMLAMERLHNCITTKPKDFSLWERVKSESQDSAEDGTLNEGLLSPSTLEKSEIRISHLGDRSMIVQVPNVVIISPDEEKEGTNFPPTSTPMVRVKDPTRTDDLHESYIDSPPATPSLRPCFLSQQLPPQPMIMTPMPLLPSKKKKKSRPVDLLFVKSTNSPVKSGFSPMTPAIKRLLTPSHREPTVVPLNMLQRKETPLFIVHPITGKVVLLKTLGSLLTRQCYGIQRTNSTPRDTLVGVASYYNNAVQMQQTKGPYVIAGYSFGTMIAIEMALQLQHNKKKVDKLILLDGGPDYFCAQFRAAQKHAKDLTEMALFLEIGALINFLMMFVHVPNIRLVQNILYQLPNQEARIQTVVEMSFNKVEISSGPSKTRWLTAKEKIFRKIKEAKESNPKMADAAQEVLTWKRREQAADFIKSVNMVKTYKNDHGKFKGDIHLLRIKSDPPMCDYLSVDYGLQDWCTGKVHISFYNGTHETFLNHDAGKEVADEITKILTSTL